MTPTHMQRARGVVQRRFNCFYLIDIASPADGGRDSLRGQNPFTEAFFFSSVLPPSCLDSVFLPRQSTRARPPGTRVQALMMMAVMTTVSHPRSQDPASPAASPRMHSARAQDGLPKTAKWVQKYRGAPRTKTTPGDKKPVSHAAGGGAREKPE